MKHANTVLFSLCILFSTNTHAQSWTEVGTGINTLHANNQINTLCRDPAGNIYAAGRFYDTAGEQLVEKWNGMTWQKLPSFPSFGCCNNIFSLCADSVGNIYAAGLFNDTLGYNYVAKWDGTAWSETGSGGGAVVLAIDSHGNLYTTRVTDSGDSYVVMWNGSSWSSVGSGSSALYANGAIYSIYIDGHDNLYAAGSFTDGSADTVGNLYVAMWNGSAWSEVGSGVGRHGGQIYSVAADNYGNVYAGGNFLMSSGMESVAEWNGSSWSALVGGVPLLGGPIEALCFDSASHLYAAGYLCDTEGGAPCGEYTYVASWDGTKWSKVNGDLYSYTSREQPITTLLSDPAGNIYAAGSFTDTTTLDSIFVASGGPPLGWRTLHPEYVAEYTPSYTGVPTLGLLQGADVYPNPTTDHVYVKMSSSLALTPEQAYCLYDCLGRVIMSGSLQANITDLDLARLAPGMYILKLSGAVNAAYQVAKE